MQPDLTISLDSWDIVGKINSKPDNPESSLASLSTVDLVRACLDDGSPEVWEEFVHRFQPLITRVVVRLCQANRRYDPNEVEDMVQACYSRLCARRFRVLREFKAANPDSFYGLIKVIAANTARDHLRKIRAIRRNQEITVSIDQPTGPLPIESKTASPEQIEQGILIGQISQVLEAVAPRERDRNIFWLHFRHGMSSAAIAEIRAVGLDPKGVESLLRRLVHRIREKMLGEKKDSPPKGKAAGSST